MSDRWFHIFESSETSEMYNVVSNMRNHFEEYKGTLIKIKIFKKRGGIRTEFELKENEDIPKITEKIKQYFTALQKWDVMSVRIEPVKVLEKV